MKKTNRALATVTLASAILMVGATAGFGAQIEFSHRYISSLSDISSVRETVVALNTGSRTFSPTINGVTFTAWTNFNNGEHPLVTCTDWRNENTWIGGWYDGDPDLGSDFRQMLGQVSFPNSGVEPVMTFKNLTVGQLYMVQLFFCDDRFDGTGTIDVVSGDTYHEPGLGEIDAVQFQNAPGALLVTGIFRADALTQSLSTSGGPLNAMQFRLIPEPSVLALMMFGGVALITRRRRG